MIDILSSTSVQGRVCCAVGTEVWVALSSGQLRIFRAADAVALQDVRVEYKESRYVATCGDVHISHDTDRVKSSSSSSHRVRFPSSMIAVRDEVWLGMPNGVVIRLSAATRQVCWAVDITTTAQLSRHIVANDKNGTTRSSMIGGDSRTSTEHTNNSGSPMIYSTAARPSSVAKVVHLCSYAHPVFDFVVAGCASGEIALFSSHMNDTQERKTHLRGMCRSSAPCTAVGVVHHEVCVRSPSSPCGVVVSTEVIVVAGDSSGALYAWDSDNLESLAVHTKCTSAVTCMLYVESYSSGIVGARANEAGAANTHIDDERCAAARGPRRDAHQLLWVARENGSVDFYLLLMNTYTRETNSIRAQNTDNVTAPTQSDEDFTRSTPCAHFGLHDRQSSWGRVLSLTMAQDVVVAHTQARELLLIDRHTRVLLRCFARAHDRHIFGTTAVAQQTCIRIWSVGSDAQLRVWRMAQDVQPLVATSQCRLSRVVWREDELCDSSLQSSMSSSERLTLPIPSSLHGERESSSGAVGNGKADTSDEVAPITAAQVNKRSLSLLCDIYSKEGQKSGDGVGSRRLWLREAWDSVALRNALEHTRTAFAELQLCHTQCTSKAAAADEELQKRECKINELQASAGKVAKQVSDVTSQVNIVTHDRNALQETVTRLRDEVGAAQAAVKQAQEAQLGAERAQARLEQECVTLTRRLADAEAQIASLRVKHTQLEQNVQSSYTRENNMDTHVKADVSTREKDKTWTGDEVKRYATHMQAELGKAHATLYSALYTIRTLEADKTDLLTMLTAFREQTWPGHRTHGHADPFTTLPLRYSGGVDTIALPDVSKYIPSDDMQGWAQGTSSSTLNAGENGVMAPTSSIPFMMTADTLAKLLDSMLPAPSPAMELTTTNSAPEGANGHDAQVSNTGGASANNTASTTSATMSSGNGLQTTVPQQPQGSTGNADIPRNVDELLQRLGIAAPNAGKASSLAGHMRTSPIQASQATTGWAKTDETSFCRSVGTAPHILSHTEAASYANDNSMEEKNKNDTRVGGHCTFDDKSGHREPDDEMKRLWDLSVLCAGDSSEVTTMRDLRVLFEFILATRAELVNSLVALERRAVKAQQMAHSASAHDRRLAKTPHRRYGSPQHEQGMYRIDTMKTNMTSLTNVMLHTIDDLARQATKIVWRFLTRSEKKRLGIT